MMPTSRHVCRVALIGLPGAGKSTSAAMLRQSLAQIGHDSAVVKIASPLYDVQSYFYARADTKLADGQQDGSLLNFLGSHFRAVAPDFLLSDFSERCAAARLAGAHVIICEDARPLDLDGLIKQGFVVVRISAPDTLRRQRKAGRGDKVVGRDDHPTELGTESVSPHFGVDNSRGLAELASEIRSLAKILTDRHTLNEDRIDGDVVCDGSLVIRSLVRRARAAISRRYVENRHQIGAAILTADGRVFTGVHLEAMVGRASICAEAVALGKACEAGATDIRVVVACRHPKPTETNRELRLVPPCGLCRELLLDYGENTQVVIEAEGAIRLAPLAQLLPHKYVGTKWKGTDV